MDETGTSGSRIGISPGKPRRRTSRSKRKSNDAVLQFNQSSILSSSIKRKADEEDKQGSTIKRKLNVAVPMEGVPKDQ